MMPVTNADHEMAMRMRGASFGEIKDLLAEHRGASCASLSSDLQEARAELERVRSQLADALGTIRNLTTPRTPACSHRTVNSCGECWDCGAIV